ncbi:MAG TPA: CHAT domain-containing protein, partial [Myxococcota bacterium]|nr:CHAT domain-containing protein [Myxococcota bacterium]
MLAIVGSPQEADVLRRAFMKAKVYRATEATLANWRENAPKATYLHLGQLPTTPDGGIRLSDGVLSLAEIGSTNLAAQVAFVEGTGALGALERAQVLRKAGVPDVMALGWTSDRQIHLTTVGYWWELVSGKSSAGRALSEARPRALKEADATARQQPQIWGGYFLVGRF